MNQKIIHFNSVEDLKDKLEKQIKNLDNKIELHSKLIGDKIREGEKENSEEFSDLKDKLNSGKSNNKKSNDKKPDKKHSKNKKSEPKKKKSKKGESENWIEYENLHLFNGVGTRGELELYFKSLEEMKNDSEKLKTTKDSLEKLMVSGIKKDLGGVGYEHPDGTFELAFIKTESKREKFSFKTILTVGCEC
ncbi:MAG: hypothetical protein PVH93_07515 [Nitrosopumilaceae archaeon]